MMKFKKLEVEIDGALVVIERSASPEGFVSIMAGGGSGHGRRTPLGCDRYDIENSTDRLWVTIIKVYSACCGVYSASEKPVAEINSVQTMPMPKCEWGDMLAFREILRRF